MAVIHTTVLFVQEAGKVVALRVNHRLESDRAAHQALEAAARAWAHTADAASIVHLQNECFGWRNTPAIPSAVLDRYGILSVERRPLPDPAPVPPAGIVLDGAENLLAA